MGNPDLVALWEAHCRYEFETRDVDATIATMVAAPYVNHIPTMTGGVGHDQLKRFYKYHFIGVNPPDFRLTLISRTVGANCVVDEFIMHFTHTREMDWLLPGVSPTGRTVEIPTVAIVQFEAWSMSISTGTRRLSSSKSACSIQLACRWRAWRPHARSPTKRDPATSL